MVSEKHGPTWFDVGAVLAEETLQRALVSPPKLLPWVGAKGGVRGVTFEYSIRLRAYQPTGKPHIVTGHVNAPVYGSRSVPASLYAALLEGLNMYERVK